MKKKASILIASIICIFIIILFLIPRENPGDFVSHLWQNSSDWGNVKVSNIEHLSGYTVVHIQYEAKNGFQPTDRWIVKDRKKVRDMQGNEFAQWEGYVYLVKQGLYSWRIVQ
ncbi:hypothetical protein [Paenibacillus rhizophilus]|uniref:Uncharacterized protein n=1 Tax=Paenibacillus rhizophilus TaxID=1850366 RepID=A0A3N9P9Y5_9BACL|nr:hypothetical protein [Paenibacillus rhizophilus]RQW13058.1 hypothetical protein EH198_01100 [Paenibacillus rhizophilus]